MCRGGLALRALLPLPFLLLPGTPVGAEDQEDVRLLGVGVARVLLTPRADGRRIGGTRRTDLPGLTALSAGLPGA
ncbi:hypothetical protein A6A08_02955 [Nocardiopsis sp. TSRI0078]|nr:hypothetical protein A6A08_02955 [Nocardiopsis sp. TSRI0078]